VPADGGREALLGAAACAGMFVIWTVVHDRSPREALAIADSTADLSAASEDELLRTMRPTLRLASLTVRCLSVALETAADTLLIWVYLPALTFDPAHLAAAVAVSTQPPTAGVAAGGAAEAAGGEGLAMPPHPLTRELPLHAAAAAALVYGSIHLRFRHEWLICTGFGAALAMLVRERDGSLHALLLASVLFAVLRHVKRSGLDVRRSHHQ